MAGHLGELARRGRQIKNQIVAQLFVAKSHPIGRADFDTPPRRQIRRHNKKDWARRPPIARPSNSLRAGKNGLPQFLPPGLAGFRARRAKPTMRNGLGNCPSAQRWQRAGMSLRDVRSPLAPKMTTVQGLHRPAARVEPATHDFVQLIRCFHTRTMDFSRRDLKSNFVGLAGKDAGRHSSFSLR